MTSAPTQTPGSLQHESADKAAMTTTTSTPGTLQAQALAHQLLTNSARGKLTLINGTALRPYGGWNALGTAFGTESEELNDIDLLISAMGANPNSHPLDTAMRADGICSFIDHDINLPRPDIEWDLNPDLEDVLPFALETFGNPSITSLARRLYGDKPSGGQSVILLTGVGSARPYREIIRRQHLMDDRSARDAAIDETYDWLALDLAALASMRPTEPTIIASNDQAPEWVALAKHAALILP